MKTRRLIYDQNAVLCCAVLCVLLHSLAVNERRGAWEGVRRQRGWRDVVERMDDYVSRSHITCRCVLRSSLGMGFGVLFTQERDGLLFYSLFDPLLLR